MDSTPRRLRRPASRLAAGIVIAMLMSMLPFAGIALAASGPGTHLKFSTQPVGGVDHGTNLPSQPVVHILNSSGNLVTSGADSKVTVYLTLLPPSIGGPGKLSCLTNHVKAVGGVATFSSCTINTNPGIGYRLQAAATLSSGATSVVSAQFDIGSDLPTSVVFTTQPGTGMAYSTLSVQPVVQLQDFEGQLALQDNSTVVTLALGSNPGGGTLTCTGGLSATVVMGTATFTGCSIDAAGTGYTLVATSNPAPTTATSSTFTVTPNSSPGTQLVFSTQPTGGVDRGTALPTQPVIQVLDANNHVVAAGPDSKVTVYLTRVLPVLGGPGTLTCVANHVKAVAGVATFSGCAIASQSGVGFALHAAATLSTGATGVDSALFNIDSDVPTRLAFTTQPGSGTAGSPLTVQPVVQVRDAGNQPAFQDNSTVVTLALASNPGGGTLTCTGGLSATVVNGSATFTGCSISNAGTGHKIVATSSPALTAATSAKFDVGT